MRRHITTILLTLALLASLGACGQKGPLERPGESATASTGTTAWKRA